MTLIGEPSFLEVTLKKKPVFIVFLLSTGKLPFYTSSQKLEPTRLVGHKLVQGQAEATLLALPLWKLPVTRPLPAEEASPALCAVRKLEAQKVKVCLLKPQSSVVEVCLFKLVKLKLLLLKLLLLKLSC